MRIFMLLAILAMTASLLAQETPKKAGSKASAVKEQVKASESPASTPDSSVADTTKKKPGKSPPAAGEKAAAAKKAVKKAGDDVKAEAKKQAAAAKEQKKAAKPAADSAKAPKKAEPAGTEKTVQKPKPKAQKAAQAKPADVAPKQVKEAEQEKAPKAVSPKASGADVNISRLVVCTAVENHEPEGKAETFAKDVGKLRCFSHVTGAKDSTQIQHRWYYKGALIGLVPLAVRSSSYRTYSTRTIEETQTGEWRVDVLDAAGEQVLKSVTFTVE